MAVEMGTTRDPQSKGQAAVSKGAIATAATAFVAAFCPDVEAAKALAALGLVSVVMGYVGAAARDWSYKIAQRAPSEEGGFFLWLLMRLG